MNNDNFSLVMEELGFSNIPVELLDTDRLYDPQSLFFFFFELGIGTYDYATYEWAPTSQQVYSLDMEAHEISSMYINFLKGIESIGNGELKFTNISDSRRFDSLDGAPQTVSFDLNGTPCSVNLTVNSDWYDPEIIDQLNSIFDSLGHSNRLYFSSDGDVCCIFFYCSEEWAKLFTAKTGIDLFTSTTDFLEAFGLE